jgi:ferredoxin-NADP reductase
MQIDLLTASINNLAPTLGLVVGWLLIGWAALRGGIFAATVVVRKSRWRRDYERELAEFCRRVEATARAARATHAIPDWKEWRPFRVAAIIDEARDVKSFYLVPVDGRPLSPFAPGQYLTFRLPVADRDAPLVRCYSLSDRPRQDYYRVTVKRVGPPSERPDLPVGRGSNHFHDRVRVGDVLNARAPAGTFLIDPQDDAPIVLIGAGIGATPLMSMLESIVHRGRPRDVHLILCFRNSGEHPFKERIVRIAAANPAVRLHVNYSAPEPGDIAFKDYTDRGRLVIDRVRQVLPSNNFHFYVCGPSGLMESLVPALWNWGVPESHVHFEAFGPASVKGVTASRRDAAERCEVRFERTGRTATWDGSFATLLEFAEAAGIAMPSGCRAGSCGECLTAVRGGNVITVKQPGIPVSAGHCLTCISVPAGDLVLDA